MDVSTEKLDDRTASITVSGEVEMGAPARLEQLLGGLIATGMSRIVVDLSAVSFLNSKLLDTLVRLSAGIEARDGGIAVVTGHDYVRHMLEVTEAGGVLLLEDDKDEALAALAGAPT